MPETPPAHHRVRCARRVAFGLDALLLFLSAAFLYILVFHKIPWWPSLHATLNVYAWGSWKTLSVQRRKGLKRLEKAARDGGGEAARAPGAPTAAASPAVGSVAAGSVAIGSVASADGDGDDAAERSAALSRKSGKTAHGKSNARRRSSIKEVAEDLGTACGWFRRKEDRVHPEQMADYGAAAGGSTVPNAAVSPARRVVRWVLDLPGNVLAWFRGIPKSMKERLLIYEAQRQLALWKIERSAAFASSSKAGGCVYYLIRAKSHL